MRLKKLINVIKSNLLICYDSTDTFHPDERKSTSTSDTSRAGHSERAQYRLRGQSYSGSEGNLSVRRTAMFGIWRDLERIAVLAVAPSQPGWSQMVLLDQHHAPACRATLPQLPMLSIAAKHSSKLTLLEM